MEPKYFESLYPAKTRFSEIEKIIEKLRSGRSVQLIGAPGVGKGNVLRLLPYNKELRILHLGQDADKYHFVYMDFAEVRGRPLFDIIKFILVSISYSLSERSLNDDSNAVNKILKEGIVVSDEMMLFQALKKTIDYLANEKDINVVLLIDRFEDYVSNINEDFFSYLKILRNRAKYKFAVVIASTRPLDDMIESQILGDFYEFIAANIVYLDLYDKVGLEFRFQHLEKITGKKLDIKIQNQIIKFSAGHGKIARHAYEALLAFEPDKTLNLFLLENKQVRASLFEIWQFLTPKEKDDVKKKEENVLLEKLGLTKKGEIAIPLLDEFIKTISDSAQAKLTYDDTANSIMRGEEDLGEQFSPSEFRLLRFLLKNTGRICEKDEIINSVWSDEKSKEGVSDQALDQIIYRLRKKIESDPNAPKIIQTVKGRGYKLNQ